MVSVVYAERLVCSESYSLIIVCRAAEKMQTATASGWQQARDLTSEGIKRLYGGPLEVCQSLSLQIRLDGSVNLPVIVEAHAACTKQTPVLWLACPALTNVSAATESQVCMAVINISLYLCRHSVNKNTMTGHAPGPS